MTDKILSMIKNKYRLRSLDAGVFHKMVVRGMDFEVHSLEAVNFGRVATMRAKGLFGMIKRDLVIVSPLEKDVPVITYERVKAFGKDTLVLGRYDLQNEAKYIKKAGKKKQSAEFDEVVEQYFVDYMLEIDGASEENVKVRKEKVETLVKGLIDEARLSSDIFMVTYGEKITEKLYHQVMFGSR